MRKFIKDNIFKVVVLIPIITSIIGMIIFNLHLSKYGIIDYSLFQTPISLYIGTAFFIIIIAIFIYYLLMLDFVNSEKNKMFYVLLLTTVKFFVITLISYHFLIGEYSEYRLPLNLTIAPDEMNNFLFPVVAAFLILLLGSIDYKEGAMTLRTKIIYNIMFCLSSVISATLFFKIKNEPLFNDIAFFCFLPAFAVIIRIFVRKDLTLRKNYYENQNNEHKIASYFSDKMTNKSIYFDIIFDVFLLLLAFFTLVNTYTSSIYPYLPQKYGGCKTEIVNIHYDDNKQIVGDIIHMTNDTLYVLNNNKELHILKKEMLNKIVQLKD